MEQRLNISVAIPLKAHIVHSTQFPLDVVSQGSLNKWSHAELGDFADKRGVYVLYSDGKILYVGKTTEGNFNFGERLYRHFHQTASANSSLHQLLASQKKRIYGYFLDLQDIDMMVNPGPMVLKPERKALIMEQALIGIYSPVGNNQ